MKKSKKIPVITLKQFSEQYLPRDFAKREVLNFPAKEDYSRRGKVIIEEIRKKFGI